MILKLIKYSLTMLLCCITLISCGQENISTNKPDIGKKENYSTGTPDIIENSSLPTQTPKKSKGRNKSKRGELQAIYGKWEILDMVGYGYIYGEFSMKDYVGGTVTIRENYIESNLPLGRWKLKIQFINWKNKMKRIFGSIVMLIFIVDLVLKARKLKQ